MKIYGDVLDDAGNPIMEEVELWTQDPIHCIKELIGNPAFWHVMKYAPEKVFLDKDGKLRAYSETWTGDWWLELQVRRSQKLAWQPRSDIHLPCAEATASWCDYCTSHTVVGQDNTFCVQGR